MVSKIKHVACLSAVLIVAACASAKPRLADGSKAGCPLQARDSAYLYIGPVYRDCAVDTKALMIGNPPRLDYQPSGACSAADVQFVVDTQGRVESGSEQVIRTTDRNLANALVAVLPAIRFEPAKVGERAVRQIYLQKMVTGVVAVPQGKNPPRQVSRSDMPRC